MLYIKVMSHDGTIIGAEAHERPAYVNHPNNSKIPLRCSPVQAQGVLSLDVSQIYQLTGRPIMPGGYLLAEEISGADYDNIIRELDPPEEDVDPDDPDEGGSDIMNLQQMRERIIALEEESAAQKAENEELKKELADKGERIEHLEGAMIDVGGILYGM